MRSLNKGNKRDPEKKKAVPAVKKESHKTGASLAAAKKPEMKKVAGKGKTQPGKKEAPKATAKPPKKPVLPAAVKKQPAKPKPAAKAAQPVVKQEAPAVKEKPVETKVISPETDQRPEEKKVVVVEKIRPQKVMVVPVDLGRRYKCYKCGIKFYDLGRPQPLCPSCGANQLDGVIKAARKRRGKHRPALAAKTEPLTVAPGENEDLHEVANELDADYVLDVDDIVLEEHQDSEDKD